MSPAIPQLIGAPAPQDVGGAVYGSVKAAGDAAQMQTQAAQQGAALILNSLQSALELRARRDEAKREREAREKLQTMSDTAASERQAASDRAAKERQEASDRAALEREQLSERGATRRARMQERGANVRAVREMRQSEAHFQTTSQMERQRLDLASAASTREQEELALHLAEGKRKQDLYDAQQAALAAVPRALIEAPWEVDPTTGAKTLNFQKALQVLQQFQGPQAQGMQGPATPQEEAAQRPEATPAFIEALQGALKPGNEAGIDSARVRATGAGRGSGGTMGSMLDYLLRSGQMPREGAVPIGSDILQKLAEASGNSELSTLSNASPTYDLGTGKVNAQGAGADLLSALQQAVDTVPGARVAISGAGTVGPFGNDSDRNKAGIGYEIARAARQVQGQPAAVPATGARAAAGPKPEQYTPSESLKPGERRESVPIGEEPQAPPKQQVEPKSSATSRNNPYLERFRSGLETEKKPAPSKSKKPTRQAQNVGPNF